MLPRQAHREASAGANLPEIALFGIMPGDAAWLGCNTGILQVLVESGDLCHHMLHVLQNACQVRSRGGCVLHLHPSRAQQDEHL